MPQTSWRPRKSGSLSFFYGSYRRRCRKQPTEHAVFINAEAARAALLAQASRYEAVRRLSLCIVNE